MYSIRETVANTALSYVGKKEIPKNAGWYDKVFAKKMIDMGWKKGWHWCAIFAKLVYKESYNKYYTDNPLGSISIPDAVKKYLSNFSPNSQRTYNNYRANGFPVLSYNDVMEGKRPQKGDIMIFHYKGVTGHTGIVIEVSDKSFRTVEGNASDMVKMCTHEFLKTPQLMGFVQVYE